MDCSEYLEAMSTYKNVEKLGRAERSLFFKIMNGYYPIPKMPSYGNFGRRRRLMSTDEQNSLKTLQELNLVEEACNNKGSLQSNELNYRLSTFGLFYILSNMMNYPPQLLKRYQHDIMLQTLLFPYFEVCTIERATARFYSVITEYLRECSKATLRRVDAIEKATSTGTATHAKDDEMFGRSLGYDLREQVEVLAFKLCTMYSESNILMAVNSCFVANDSARVALYELESTMKTTLSRDEKFMQLLGEIRVDFRSGYDVLVGSKTPP
jgi:hypothetical protein